ncbi:MAG: hypothetical protein IPL83_07465 [Bdellovibrionales bacterium]|nr:hypothetical protein [Bdellovibrionales bacterium]
MRRQLVKLSEHIREIALFRTIEDQLSPNTQSTSANKIWSLHSGTLLILKLSAALSLILFSLTQQTSLAEGNHMRSDAYAQAIIYMIQKKQEQEAAAELQSVNAALAAERQAFRERLEILKQSRIEFINTLKNLSNQHREADLPLLAVRALVQAASGENELMKENAQQFMAKSSGLLESLSDFNYFNKKSHLPWSYEGPDPFISLKLILRTVSLADGPPNPNDPDMDWLTLATQVLSEDENSIVNRYMKSATLLNQAAQSPYVKEFRANEERLFQFIQTSETKLKEEEKLLNQIAQITMDFALNSALSEQLIRTMDPSFLTGETTLATAPRGREAILHQIASARQEIQTIKAQKDAMPAKIDAENSIQKGRMDELAKAIEVRIKEIETRITEHEALKEHLKAKTEEIGNLKKKLIDFQNISKEAVDGFRVVSAGLDKRFFNDRITLIDFAKSYIQIRGSFSESERSELDKIAWTETKGRLEGKRYAYENLKITLDGFIDQVSNNSLHDLQLLINSVEDSSKNQEILTKNGIDFLNRIKTIYLSVSDLLTGKKR